MVKMTAVKQDGSIGITNEIDLPFNTHTFKEGAELVTSTKSYKFVVFTNIGVKEEKK